MALTPAQEKKSKTVLYGGLGTIVVCVVALVLLVTSYHHETQAAFDENTTYRDKAQITATMHEIVYLRTYMLSYTATIEDYFERDEERLRFNEHAQNMIRARNQMVEMGLSAEEKVFFDKMTEEILGMHPIVVSTMDLAVEEPGSEAFLTSMREARRRQLELQDTIDSFAAYYDGLSVQNTIVVQRTLENLWQKTVVLCSLLLAAVVAIGLYVVRSEAQTKRQLRKAVAARTAELRIERDRAAQANRYKSKFLATMSHELRTPLNAIIGFSDMIRCEIMGKISPPQYIEYAQDVYNSGSYLLNLINEILDMSKIEAGEFKIFPANFNLHEAVDEALVMVEVQAHEKHINLCNEIPATLPLVTADPRVTKQIIINLVTNAVKFTPQDGTVSLTACVQQDVVEVCVEDTGSGMSPEDAKAVLEPFIQAAHNQQGTGLGLSLCKNFVELQGGSFSLSSELGKGTRATFTMPLSVEDQDADVADVLSTPHLEQTSWLPSMSVGVKKWDEDHKTLLALLAQLPTTPEENITQENFDAVLDELVHYMEDHLLSEENVLKAYGYPEFEAHKAKHDEFRKWVVEQKKLRQTASDTRDCLETARFIVNWWHFHIMKVDMEYKSFFEHTAVASPTE